MSTILTSTFSSDSEDEDFVPTYDPEDTILTDQNGKAINTTKKKYMPFIGLKRNSSYRNSMKKKKTIGADVLSDEDDTMDSIVPTNVINTIEINTIGEEKKSTINQEKISEKINSLWDTLKSSSSIKPTTPATSALTTNTSISNSAKPKLDFTRKTAMHTAVVEKTKIAEFAGELVTVKADPNAKQKVGLDAALDILKQKQITTVVKSKSDWEEDKKKTGDTHELEQNRKDGHLGKVEFLARVEATKNERDRLERIARYDKMVTSAPAPK